MTIDQALSEKIEQVAVPLAQEMALELVDLIVRPSRTTVHIQILADRKEGGITIDECSALNRKIGNALDERAVLSTSYLLEVSSPGLDRPLRRKQEFVRAVGRPARFFLGEPLNGKIEYAGTIQAVSDDAVTVSLDDGATVIPMQSIRMAKYIID